MELVEAHLSNGETIRYYPFRKLGEGTEKEFFATEHDDRVIGFYKDQAGTYDPERLRRLTAIIEKFNPTRDTENGEFWKTHFCWSTAIVISPKIGIVSPKFPSRYYFSDGRGEKKSRWFSNIKLVQRLPETERGNWSDRMQMCRHLARAVGRMHTAGLAHSDLSGNNILMNPAGGECILIDIDSLVVKGIFPPKILGTKGYIAPEVVATSMLPIKHPHKHLPNIGTDLHALAVIIYQMLLFRHPLEGKNVWSDDPESDDLLSFGEKALFIENPKDDSNRPDNLKISFDLLGHHLASLIGRAFTEGLKSPDLRPTAFEWEKALTLTMDMLHPCEGEGCWHRWFVCQKGYDSECPFCGWKPKEPVPILHLFRKYKAGQYLLEKHHITIWNDKKLYPWHIRSDIAYPQDIGEHRECAGVFFSEDGHWKFRNQSRKKMICSRKYLRHDEVINISDHDVILFDEHPKGRLAISEF
jgi:hypothetical protein